MYMIVERHPGPLDSPKLTPQEPTSQEETSFESDSKHCWAAKHMHVKVYILPYNLYNFGNLTITKKNNYQ